MERTILLIFAHPDDESFGTGGTAAKYSRQGVAVDLICATRGEKGDRLNVPPAVDTGTAREAELRAAGAIIGIRKVYFLDYVDGELDKASFSDVTSRIIKIMREVKPQVVITFGPDGITGHPDHIAIGKAARRAFEKLKRSQKGLGKLYYVTIPETTISNGEEPGLATRPDDEVSTAIDISSVLDTKIRAIAAHWSQSDAREFLATLRESQDEPFNRQEFFYLAYPRRAVKETDLFQKVRAAK
ncbi:MAG: PIG-L family deacetylase [Chloroflexi bacterium]|nr:PIG-L family deacetylase [Chloroflexota bacterium]